MPIPPLIIPPIPPHLILAPGLGGPATLAAVRSAATSAAASNTAAAGVSYLLASALAKQLWKQTPDWVREDESWKALSRSGAGNDGSSDGAGGGDAEFRDEMASLTAVIQKLEALVVTGYDKLGSQRRMGRRRHVIRRTVASSRQHLTNDGGSETVSRGCEVAGEDDSSHQKLKQSHSLTVRENENEENADISTLEWHAALLAYWQLCNQIRERHPSWRDRMYRRGDIFEHNAEDQCSLKSDLGGNQGENSVNEKSGDAINDQDVTINGHGVTRDVDNKNSTIQEENANWGFSLQTKRAKEKQAGTIIEDKSDVDKNGIGERNNVDENIHEKLHFDTNLERQADATRANIQRQGARATQRADTSVNGQLLVKASDGPESTHKSPRVTDGGAIITSSKLRELKVMLDYAIWAYEPKEELLRSWLLTGVEENTGREKIRDDARTKEAGGYQLIVHRTTSYMDPEEEVVDISETKQTKKKKKDTKSPSKKIKRKPPGRVGYFVAVSHGKRTMLIGIKGTSTLEDLLTDCCGRAVRVDLENDPHGCPAINDDDGNDEESIDVADEGRGAPGDASIIGDEAESHVNEKKDLMDKVHVSTRDDTCPSESVEVELFADDRIGSAKDNDVVSINSSHDLTSCKSNQRHERHPAMPKSKKKTSLTGIPSSENVLLLPSLSRSSPPQKQQDSTLSSPPEIIRSPSEEFMESHGIEMEENRSHKLRGAHEGILHCAHQLIFEIAPLVEEYAISKGYDVIITGHSLGAGTAVLLAVLIRGRYPELAVPKLSNSATGDDGAESRNDSNRQRVRVYAFAPPPVLDRASALACRHYVTSIANNSDIIPRSSLTNLDAFLTVLEAVRCRLVEAGLNPGSGGNSSSSQGFIASTIALFRKLSEGTDGDLLLDPMELRKVSEEAVAEASLGDGENGGFYWDEEFGHHLFVPGKLLMMHETWSLATSKATGNSVGSSEERNVTGLSQPSPKKERKNHDQGVESESQSGRNDVAFHAMWTDGMDTVLRQFEVGAGIGMVTDHLTTSYDRALSLLE